MEPSYQLLGVQVVLLQALLALLPLLSDTNSKVPAPIAVWFYEAAVTVACASRSVGVPLAADILKRLTALFRKESHTATKRRLEFRAHTSQPFQHLGDVLIRIAIEAATALNGTADALAPVHMQTLLCSLTAINTQHAQALSMTAPECVKSLQTVFIEDVRFESARTLVTLVVHSSLVPILSSIQGFVCSSTNILAQAHRSFTRHMIIAARNQPAFAHGINLVAKNADNIRTNAANALSIYCDCEFGGEDASALWAAMEALNNKDQAPTPAQVKEAYTVGTKSYRFAWRHLGAYLDAIHNAASVSNCPEWLKAAAQETIDSILQDSRVFYANQLLKHKPLDSAEINLMMAGPAPKLFTIKSILEAAVDRTKLNHLAAAGGRLMRCLPLLLQDDLDAAATALEEGPTKAWKDLRKYVAPLSQEDLDLLISVCIADENKAALQECAELQVEFEEALSQAETILRAPARSVSAQEVSDAVVNLQTPLYAALMLLCGESGAERSDLCTNLLMKLGDAFKQLGGISGDTAKACLEGVKGALKDAPLRHGDVVKAVQSAMRHCTPDNFDDEEEEEEEDLSILDNLNASTFDQTPGTNNWWETITTNNNKNDILSSNSFSFIGLGSIPLEALDDDDTPSEGDDYTTDMAPFTYDYPLSYSPMSSPCSSPVHGSSPLLKVAVTSPFTSASASTGAQEDSSSDGSDADNSQQPAAAAAQLEMNDPSDLTMTITTANSIYNNNSVYNRIYSNMGSKFDFEYKSISIFNHFEVFSAYAGVAPWAAFKAAAVKGMPHQGRDWALIVHPTAAAVMASVHKQVIKQQQVQQQQQVEQQVIKQQQQEQQVETPPPIGSNDIISSNIRRSIKNAPSPDMTLAAEEFIASMDAAWTGAPMTNNNITINTNTARVAPAPRARCGWLRALFGMRRRSSSA